MNVLQMIENVTSVGNGSFLTLKQLEALLVANGINPEAFFASSASAQEELLEDATRLESEAQTESTLALQEFDQEIEEARSIYHQAETKATNKRDERLQVTEEKSEEAGKKRSLALEVGRVLGRLSN